MLVEDLSVKLKMSLYQAKLVNFLGLVVFKSKLQMMD